MYKLKEKEYITAEPWLESFPSRIKRIYEAKGLGFYTVVYIYQSVDTSTYRYRVFNMCQAIELGLSWRGSWFYYDELTLLPHHLDCFDLIIIGRGKYNFDILSFVQLAQKAKKGVFFDIDDMVYDLKYLPRIVNTLSVNMRDDISYDYWFSYISRIAELAKISNGIITTNQFLAQKMEKDLEKRCFIIQNFLNSPQIEVSENYYQQKKGALSIDQYVIGYFSGTPSHINDFMSVAPELKVLLEKYEDIILRIVGFMQMPDFLLELESQKRIERVPLQNFIALQKYIAEVDVNIAPLVNDDFSNCKSELKFFEAAIVGTITCATPSFTFKNSIQDKITGYLCSPGEWYDTLENLYRNRKKYNTEIVKKAHDYCIKRYAYYNQTMHINEILNKAFKE